MGSIRGDLSVGRSMHVERSDMHNIVTESLEEGDGVRSARPVGAGRHWHLERALAHAPVSLSAREFCPYTHLTLGSHTRYTSRRL